MAPFFRRSGCSAARRVVAPKAQIRLDPLEPREVPAAFVVSTTADSGAGSLRAALDQANNTPGPDDITFDPGIKQGSTITLNGPITISDSVTIKGPGAANLVIDGKGQQIFSISALASATAAVTISGMTLSGGSAARGGAIYNNGASLTLLQDELDHNSATVAGGAVYSQGGNVSIIQTSFVGNQLPGVLPTPVPAPPPLPAPSPQPLPPIVAPGAAGANSAAAAASSSTGTGSGTETGKGSAVVLVNATALIENSTFALNGPLGFGSGFGGAAGSGTSVGSSVGPGTLTGAGTGSNGASGAGSPPTLPANPGPTPGVLPGLPVPGPIPPLPPPSGGFDAGAGAIAVLGTSGDGVLLVNDTIAQNNGGIVVDSGSVTIRNTILFGNAGGFDIGAAPNTIAATSRHNIVGIQNNGVVGDNVGVPASGTGIVSGTGIGFGSGSAVGVGSTTGSGTAVIGATGSAPIGALAQDPGSPIGPGPGGGPGGGTSTGTGTGSGSGLGNFVGPWFDPQLGMLQTNSQTGTEVFIPFAGSVALDQIDPSDAPAVDERGVARPADAKSDIGAIEGSQAAPPRGTPVPIAAGAGASLENSSRQQLNQLINQLVIANFQAMFARPLPPAIATAGITSLQDVNGDGFADVTVQISVRVPRRGKAHGQAVQIFQVTFDGLTGRAVAGPTLVATV